MSKSGIFLLQMLAFRFLLLELRTSIYFVNAKVDKQIFDNCIEMDHSEAETFEFIR